MIIPLNPDLTGTRCTIGALGDKLGAYLHVNNVGPLRPDGRRKADQAPHTQNKGNLGALLARVRKAHALKTMKFERAMARSEDPQLAKPIRDRAHQRAEEIDVEQSKLLAKALEHLHPNIATVDCEISRDDIPWFLAYGHMLEGDEGTHHVSHEYEE